MSADELLGFVAEMINKYTDGRNDLVEMIKADPEKTPDALKELDRLKKTAYSEEDLGMIKEISLYFV